MSGRTGSPAPPDYTEASPLMSDHRYDATGLGRRQGTEETLDRVIRSLHPCYYYVYAGSTIIPSIRPVDPARPGLSKLYLQHVPPPRLAIDVVRHICDRENIAFSYETTKLYARALDPAQYGGPTNETEAIGIAEDIQMTEGVTGVQGSQGVLITRGAGIGQFGTTRNPLQVRVAEDSKTVRRQEDLSFTGLVDTREMLGRLRSNLLSVPESAINAAATRLVSEAMQPVHYRLFWVSGGHTAMPSINPLEAVDPSLSSTQVDCVPPPGSAQDYINHIASLEGFHPNRLRLYQPDGEEMDSSRLIPIGGSQGGHVKSDPLLVTVEVPRGKDGEPDRETGVKHKLWWPMIIWIRCFILSYCLTAFIKNGHRLATIVKIWLWIKLLILGVSLSRRKTPAMRTLGSVVIVDLIAAGLFLCSIRVVGSASHTLIGLDWLRWHLLQATICCAVWNARDKA